MAKKPIKRRLYTEEEVKELKKTWKGKFKLWKDGCDKFKQDPPIYRIHMMQGLMVKLTIYMIIFASIYAISIGLWIFALILLPVGTVGNYYSMKNHLIKYKAAKNNYEMAGILKPIEQDISKIRRKWRIIESQIGFFGLDIIFLLLIGVMSYAYFGQFSIYQRIGIVLFSLIPLHLIYFEVIYRICKRGYNK